MTKNRLEAFSDGVLAIIITIMVLELKPPEESGWHAIISMKWKLISYVMSFLFVGVYWGNHHHLLHVMKNFSSGIMLANLNLLFWLSLIPFVTGWVGETHFASMPVAIYAALLDVCGISYTILQKVIEACQRDNVKLKIIMKGQSRKGYLSLLLYSSGIPLAFVNPYISISLFFIVSIFWLVPDKKIEKIVSGE